MPKTFRTVVAALAIIILCTAAYNYFAFADEREVRRALLGLGEKISAPIAGGLDTALAAAKLKPLLAPDVSISFQHGGDTLRRTFGQDELLRIIIGIKQRNPEFTVKLDFSRRDIRIMEGRIAAVPARTTVENSGEPFEPRMLTFMLEKSENANWRLAAIGEGVLDF